MLPEVVSSSVLRHKGPRALHALAKVTPEVSEDRATAVSSRAVLLDTGIAAGMACSPGVQGGMGRTGAPQNCSHRPSWLLEPLKYGQWDEG